MSSINIYNFSHISEQNSVQPNKCQVRVRFEVELVSMEKVKGYLKSYKFSETKLTDKYAANLEMFSPTFKFIGESEYNTFLPKFTFRFCCQELFDKGN